MSKEVKPDVETFARIKVVGVGGSGGNAINHMHDSGVDGVEFVAINTDAQDLQQSSVKNQIHIGKNLTRGLGTGMNAELGKRAAEETKEEIQGSLKGSDMVFITCGMGGGTGTGAAPVIAQVARESGALTVAVVTKPFFFEGAQRKDLAEDGLVALQKEVDALIVIPNDRLLQTVDKDTTASDAFKLCDEILREAVEGISDLITTPGIVNVDFADIRSVMESAGSALMGVGIGSGEKRAQEAAKSAINSPLLDVSVNGAEGVLFAIAGGDDLKMHEVQQAAKVITESIDQNAKVIFGAFKDDNLKKNTVRVTVIATGFPEDKVLSGGDGNSLFDFDEDEIRDEADEASRGQFDGLPATDETTEGDASGDFPSTDEDDDEADDWGSVPAFLRRSQKNNNDED
jgi:cell division protein FtsZ